MKPAILASIVVATLAAPALAQPVVAPTPETVGSARGEDLGGYNIVNSFEAGYRFADIGGNRDKYRSDVNFRNGIRLLGSSFSMNSKDGHGGMFDEILFNTQGLGNDPYEFASFRIQKNRFYRYDMLWRLDEYYNPGLAVSEGRHYRDTTRRMQDHDLILFPQSKIQFRFGYSRNNQDGPALSTVQLFDARGDEFTPFADIRRLRNEFRIGNDIEIAGFKFSWLRSWENFKEDTSYLLGASPGANPLDTTVVNSFRRTDPYHGNSPFWRGNLHGERKSWALNARISYVGARRNFALDEFATGFGRTAVNRETVATGDASRPTTAGDFSISIFPKERLSVVNNTSAYSTRIDGDSVYGELNNSTGAAGLIFFRFLGIRTITNSTDVNYRATPVVSFYGGYHYSARQIRSIENFEAPAIGPDVATSVAAEQDNHVHSGLAGLRLKPMTPLTVTLDAEISRADRPFTPISDRNFHALRGRVQYKTKSLLLSAAYRENYNTNSISISTHSARARTYSANASWTPGTGLSFDAGYSKIHLDTVSGIAFFAGGSQVRGLDSIYISNAHVVNAGARLAIQQRADLFLGYTLTKDTGDGRSAVAGNVDLNPTTLLLPVQTFPLSYQSPMARLSVRLSPKVRWNAGWQFYNYHEKFQIWVASQNYRANTGYTSLLWSF